MDGRFCARLNRDYSQPNVNRDDLRIHQCVTESVSFNWEGFGDSDIESDLILERYPWDD